MAQRIPQNSKKRESSFLFYPKDWRTDINLQSCSLAAQGLWINLMCLMHESEHYGYLEIGGKRMPDEIVSKLIGISLDEYRTLIRELLDKNIACIDHSNGGIIYCKRMVEDKKLRSLKQK